jgi:vacuolar-type H+-ATPase subunit E/Vma4
MNPTLTTAPVVPQSIPQGHDEMNVVESLRPVRDALLADASREADRLVVGARRLADQHIADVEEDIDAEVADVARRAGMSATARADHAAARAHTQSHRSMLRSRTDTNRELAAAVGAAVRALRDDARYPELLRHFEAEAKDQLGSEAEVRVDPDPDGGVVATAGSRHVDYTLRALADRALSSLADEVAALWT